MSRGKHYRLKVGDEVSFNCFHEGGSGIPDELNFPSYESIFDFFVVARARRKHMCNNCTQTIPKNTTYFGGHSIHQNFPKLCWDCAVKVFQGHPLIEFTWREDGCHTHDIREVSIQDLMRESGNQLQHSLTG